MTQGDLFDNLPVANVPAPGPKAMPQKTADVLAKLREAGGAGVTWDDWPRGFALRSRIADLRRDGYVITTENERLAGGCTRARYVLLAEPDANDGDSC